MNLTVNEAKKMVVISKYTFLEIFKSKILINVALLGCGLALVCYLASTFTYGVPQRVALDFGLGAISLSSVSMAIFMGVGLISKEIDNRTIHMVLARPVSRISFLIGRIGGMSGILFLNIIVLGIMSLTIYKTLGGEFNSMIYWAFFFTILEAIMVLLVVVFFSLLTNPILSVIFTICTFVAGHALTETSLLSFAKNSPVIDFILKLFAFILPNFHKLNLKDFVLYQQEVQTSFLLGATSYAVLYSGAMIALMGYIFSRKNLD